MAEYPFAPPSIAASAMTPEDSFWLRRAIVASWREIALVLIVTIGPFAWRSGTAARQGSAGHYIDVLMSNHTLLLNGAIESGLLAAFLLYLHWRGWKTVDFKVRPGGWSSLQGILLMVTVFIANGATVFTLMLGVYATQSHYHTFLEFVTAQVPKIQAVDLNWAVLLVTMVVNACLEELICMGYAFSQFAAKRGPLFALLLTVMLRMSCHTYQGPIHMLGIGVVFLLFGLLYWKTKNLWPLIFAHTLMDVGSGSMIKLLHH